MQASPPHLTNMNQDEQRGSHISLDNTAIRKYITQREALQTRINNAHDTMMKIQSDYINEANRLSLESGGHDFNEDMLAAQFISLLATHGESERARAHDCRVRLETLRSLILSCEDELRELEREQSDMWIDKLTMLEKARIPAKELPVRQEPNDVSSTMGSGQSTPRTSKDGNELPETSALPSKNVSPPHEIPLIEEQAPDKRKREMNDADEEATLLKKHKSPSKLPLSLSQDDAPPSPSSATVTADKEPPSAPSPAVEAPTFPGVTDPVPKHLYYAYYDDPKSVSRGWYACFIMPWDGDTWVDDLRVDLSMSRMALEEDFPACYIPEYTTSTENEDPSIRGIQSWAPGFEDGGPRVQERRFLVLFFEHRKGRAGRFGIPRKAGSLVKMPSRGNLPVDWVDAKDLRLWGTNVSGPVHGKPVAIRFLEMVNNHALVQKQQQQQQVEPDASTIAHRTSPARSIGYDEGLGMEFDLAQHDADMKEGNGSP